VTLFVALSATKPEGGFATMGLMEIKSGL